MTAKGILISFVWIAGITAGLFLFPIVLRIFAPFIAAFFVSASCQRIVKFFESKIHLSRGISSAIISTLIVSLAILAVGVVAFQLYSQSKSLFSALPAAIDSFRGQLERLTVQFDGYKHSLPKEVSALLDSLALSFKDYSQTLSHRIASVALKFAGGIASRLPNILLFITMFILATFFFIKDYRLIINFSKELFPKKISAAFSKAAEFMSHAFTSYMKAQLILMLLTTALVTVCLWIVGKDYPLLWGIVCGLVDSLPLLGTAIIFVPWAVVSILYGDTYSFIALLIIQVLVFLFRQFAEPKIVSHQIGIHPILTLISVYIGLRYFGFAGVIFAPIFMLILVNLYVSYKERLK